MAVFEGHATKRQRTDVAGRGVQSGARDRFDEPHKAGPSRVVLVGGLSNAMENDLVEAMQHFGQISYIKMVPRKGEALVEFEDIESGKACVEYVQAHPNNIINVAGNPAFFDFYGRQRIPRPGEVEMEEDGTPNRVILITVTFPKYPIDVHVIQKVTEKFGNVLRVVMIRKNGVQAMVEYPFIEGATEAKVKLNGRDIYSGCCTLKIEYARPKTLTVHKNDSETYDFTSPTPQPQHAGRGPALLDDPPEPLHNGPTVRRGPPPGRYGGPRRGQYQGFQEHGFQQQGFRGGPRGMQQYDDYDQYGGGSHDQYALQPTPQNMPNQVGNGSHVVMVYGMDQHKMNCDRLFNLLCLYGNVWKVKFMKSKPGCAMVEMGDPYMVGRAISNLSNIQFFDKTIQLAFSIQQYLASPPVAGELPDGTPAFKDFSKNRNNRFMTEQAAAKNRIQRPGTVLHFYNAHPESTSETIKELFVNAGAEPPIAVKLFEAKSEHSLTGLVEFGDRSKAIEGLVLANHTTMENPGSGRWPYIFKLCFSNSPSAT
ncbi:Heterogeneous nuclear ribonucleoprotein L [Holothuria leucospilota]|uniref:Heterogeneous nuclear ribonucleoprotein L n=1 Tax=Holothuria leucospilota TaxID=206669 RepID=A0A9Q1CH06_HOLLE|nr:Heterogeneous nuclear ribonucleoprotein L [Holothuria leucospilota]